MPSQLARRAKRLLGAPFMLIIGKPAVRLPSGLECLFVILRANSLRYSLFW